VNKKEKEFIANHFNGVVHTTFNPHGPGVVRMHLIPADDHKKAPSIVIINGKDIIPINRSWAFILAEFINNLNVHEGKEVDDAALNDIVNKTVSSMKQLYPLISRKRITSDLWTIVGTLSDIAYGKGVSGQIGYLNIGEYAPHMKAPHRMDLMVSAMTVNGKWHCNQKCLHCYAAGQMSSDEVELSTEDWKKIIDKCREAGISQLTFTGGEPTLRKDLSELIKHARWFITRLNTNGVLLTEEYCAQLKEAELDNVQITFYEYTFSHQRGSVSAGSEETSL
jgi:sulfatase maturation enzyme AslB (radical SAM superfamily)